MEHHLSGQVKTSWFCLVLSCLVLSRRTKYRSFEPFICLDLTFGSCNKKTYLYCFHLIVIVNAMLVFNRMRSYKGSWTTSGGVVINTTSLIRQLIRKVFRSISAATARLKQVHVVRSGYHCGDSKSETGTMMMMSWCLMPSDVIWHIRDKLWPMPKHGSIKSTYVRCMRV